MSGEDAGGNQQLVREVRRRCPVVGQREALRDVGSNLKVRVRGTARFGLASSTDEGLQADRLLRRENVIDIAYKVVAVSMPLVRFDIVAGVCDQAGLVAARPQRRQQRCREWIHRGNAVTLQ